jgi:hypothetical protein
MPWPYLLCRLLNALGIDAWLYRDNLKWNNAYSHKLVAAWMRILFLSYVSWLLSHVLTFLIATANAIETTETQDTDVCIMILPKIWIVIVYLFACTIGSGWQKVIAICARWWSGNLWVTLQKDIATLFLFVLVWFCWDWQNSYFQMAVMEFCVSSHRYG